MHWTLTRLTNADGVFARFVVHGGESGAFLRVLGENQVFPRGRIQSEFLLVFELAIDLDLDAPILSVAHVRRDLEPPVVEFHLLDAGTGYGALRAGIHEHKRRSVAGGTWGLGSNGTEKAVKESCSDPSE